MEDVTDFDLLQRYIHRRQLQQRRAAAMAAIVAKAAANDLPPETPRLCLTTVVVRAALYSPHVRIGRIAPSATAPSGWMMEVAR
jgi:hypothetical protein